MTERIKELYKEAVDLASAELHEWNKNWRWGNHTNFEYEKVLYKKFAELIAKDIADQFKHTFTDEQYQRRIDKEILKRYGIID